MPRPPQRLQEFQSLVEIVKDLRGPEGCPWDKEQTHESLTKFAIEEVFEFAEAVDSGDFEEMKDELGDVLFQVILHAEIARQNKKFEIADVIQNLNEKMVRRHPHVFSDVSAETSEQVLENWQEIKAREKSNKEKPLFNVPLNMPALLRSQKIGEKTNKFNFDWPDLDGVWTKVEEEMAELKEALAQKDPTSVLDELGDLLFSLAQLARHLGADSEQALRQANKKFESRFIQLKSDVEIEGKDMTKLSAEELENRWQQVKAKMKS